MLAQVVRQDVELFVENRLRYGIESHLRIFRKSTLVGDLNGPQIIQIIQNILITQTL